jgi:iron only hydrogenase large subunit-like protein
LKKIHSILVEFNALLDVVDDDERNDNEVTTEMMQLLRSFDVRGPIGHGGGTSGGYAEYVIRETIRQLAVDCIIEQKITRKNKDFEEIEIVSNGAVILRVAKAYGFRNIQNIVQKVKNRKCPYDYVEIMACPGGWFSFSHKPFYLPDLNDFL